MSDAREEVSELYAEIINQLWEQFKKLKEEQKTNVKDVLEQFKAEHKELIDKLKELTGKDNPITKEFILEQSIKNINEYRKRFEESNNKSLDMINDLKEKVDPTTKEGKEFLLKLNELENNNFKKDIDKTELLDNLIAKYNESTPLKEKLVEHIETENKGYKFKGIDDKENHVFENDNGKKLFAKVDEENKEVSVYEGEVDKQKLKSKHSFTEINKYGQVLTSSKSDSLKFDNTFVEEKGTWIKKEKAIKEETSIEGKKGNSKADVKVTDKVEEKENSVENQKERTHEKEIEYEM